MSSYSFFTFEPLYILYLGILRSMRECTVSYLMSDGPWTAGVQRGEKSFVKVPVCVLRKYSSLSTSNESVEQVPITRIDFSKSVIKCM